MYLTNSSKPDIAFAMNLLAMHSVAPTYAIGLEANRSSYTYIVQWTLDYSFKRPETPVWLDKRMLATCLIPTMPDHRLGSFSFMEERPFHRNRPSKCLWLHPQIILRLLHYMKPHASAFGSAG